jgi:hypothetical protein
LKAADTYLDGEHALTITNKDGQMAASKFPLDALTIKSVADPTAGTTAVPVVVNGTNFVARMVAKWENATGVVTDVAAGQIEKISDTQLRVTLVPGNTVGKGTLTLESPSHLRAHSDVNVVAP